VKDDEKEELNVIKERKREKKKLNLTPKLFLIKGVNLKKTLFIKIS